MDLPETFNSTLLLSDFNRKSRDIQIKQLYRTLMFYNPLLKSINLFMLSLCPDHMPFWIAMDLLKFHGGHPCGLVPALR